MKKLMRQAAIGLLLIATGGTALLALASPGNPSGDGGSAKMFEMSGSVGPVYPSVDAVLPIKVENPNRFEILVTELVIEISDATPECGAENLTIKPMAVPFTVPSRGETTVTTEIRLIEDADNDCQGVTFALEYRGVAIRP